MATGTLGLNILISASASSVGPAITSLTRGLAGISPMLAGVVGGAALVGAAVVAIGVKSVQMAAQYQQSMNMVQALTGSSMQQMNTYDASLKQLALDSGVAPNDLAKGLYQVISAGYSGAAAMKVLTLATEDSKIGMTDEATVADALTNILANFSWQTKNASQVNGIMLETVTLGKSTFQQYASTITRAASSASQFHISLQTMSAAWATMTANGIRAAQASVDFTQVVNTMYGKIGTVTKSLEKNGIAFNESAFNAASFQNKILMLNAALEQARAKHVQVTGVTLQAAQAIQTISQHMDVYKSDLATLNNQQAMGNKTQQAWAITQQGFSQQMSQLGAAMQVLFINIGQQLLPVLTRLAAAVTPLVVAFTQWLFSGRASSQIGSLLATIWARVQSVLQTLAPLFSFLGGLFRQIGGILASAFIPVWKQLVQQWQTQMLPALKQLWAALQPAMPLFKLIGMIILTVVIVALGLLVGILTGVAKALAGLLGGVATVFTGIVQIISGAVTVIGGILGFFTDLFTGHFTKLGDDLHNIWTGIVTMFAGVWHVIEGIFQAAWGVIAGFVSGLVQGVIAFFQNLFRTLVGHSIVPDMINSIIAWFTSLPGKAIAAVQSLLTLLTGFFSHLAALAIQWGVNLISGFVNGIRSMFGAVSSAIGGLASLIGSFLPHSPAKQGELSHLNEYGPNLVRGIANGITRNAGLLHSAMDTLTTPAGLAVRGNGGTSIGGNFALSNSNSSASSGAGYTSANIVLVVDGKELANVVGVRLAKQVRISGVRNI